MSAPFSTLLVDLTNWDLVLDSNGDVAVAAPPYALAQDVASAIKTFAGEVYYDSTLGVPYFAKILGKTPPLSVFQQAMETAAAAVPGVVAPVCVIEAFANRTVTGQVSFTDTLGNQQTVSI